MKLKLKVSEPCYEEAKYDPYVLAEVVPAAGERYPLRIGDMSDAERVARFTTLARRLEAVVERFYSRIKSDSLKISIKS